MRSRFDLQSGALNSKPAYTAQLSFLSALLVCGGRAAPGISLASKQQPGAHYLSILCKGKHSNNKTRVAPACHDWAVAQTGFDPSLVYAAQQAGVPTRTITNVTRRMVTPGGIGGARGNAEVRRINDLYGAYLRAGQVCLEARGYQVSR